MSTTALPHSRTGAGDELLGELIEEVSRQLEAGAAVDLDAFIAAHPERAETLRLVLPALAVLADLGRSAVREPHAGSVRESLEGPVSASWVTSGSFARSAEAAWASFTRPCKSRCAGAWP